MDTQMRKLPVHYIYPQCERNATGQISSVLNLNSITVRDRVKTERVFLKECTQHDMPRELDVSYR